MLDLKVEGMTCGHCEAAVTRAIRGVDPAAKVTVERDADRVVVESSAEPAAVLEAIQTEGYPAERRA